jgi:hypothetical protein
MADLVKIQLDLSSGAINVEAPPEALDSVFERLGAFLPQLSDAYGAYRAESNPPSDGGEGRTQTPPHPSGGELGASAETDTKSQDNGSAKGKRGTRAATSKETYKIVDLGLDGAQRDAFRQFYESKGPQSQNNQVLTVMYWLITEGGKTVVDVDDIFTGLRTVEEAIPARISSVLSNLRIAGYIVRQGNGDVLHHTGEDFVRLRLPAAVKNKKP